MFAEVVLLLVLVVVLVLLLNKKPAGLPPGEWGWPVVGAWMPSGVSMEDHARTLHRKYGDIFTWRMGSRTMVFLNNFTLIKEAFSNPKLQDRPDFFTFDSFTNFKKIGLANSNGIAWHNSRRFALRQLKDLGLGRSSLVEAIQHEVAYLVEDFKKHTHEVKPIPWSLNVAVLNVIWKLVADIRYDVDDPQIHKFQAIITEVFEVSQGVVFDMLPWLQHVSPRFLWKRFGVEKMLDKFNTIRKYLLSVIVEHEARLDPDNPRDYIDIYLMEKATQGDKSGYEMSQEELWVQVSDLFTAGSETTTQTLRWGIMFMAKYPHIQTRAQREIDDVVPRDTLPSLEHKYKLHYLEAIIHEVNRIISLLSLGVPHFASQDTELAGYKIPKGTVIMANQDMCHRDPAYWSHPEEFHPEHFLDEQGQCCSRKDSYLPFSLGRRVCPGEGLARMELYLFLAALLQNFTFSIPEGQEMVLEKDPNVILFNFPKNHDILITKRV